MRSEDTHTTHYTQKGLSQAKRSYRLKPTTVEMTETGVRHLEQEWSGCKLLMLDKLQHTLLTETSTSLLFQLHSSSLLNHGIVEYSILIG